MKFRESAEFCAIASANSAHFIYATEIPDRHITEFWSSSRCFIDRWQRKISRDNQGIASGSQGKLAVPTQNEVHELFSGEMTIRMWSTVLLAAERANPIRRDWEPIVRSVFRSMLQLRSRYLEAALTQADLGCEQTATFNTLRKGMETWVDFLCGHLAKEFDVADFLFDVERSQSYGLEHLYFTLNREAGLHLSLGTDDISIDQLAEILTRDTELGTVAAIRQSILHSFPDAAFHNQGGFRPIKLPEEMQRRLISAIRTSEQSWLD